MIVSSSRAGTSRAGIPQALRKRKEPTEVELERKENPLETTAMQERLHQLMTWRRQARVAQADNRQQMAIDEDFYDGIQYDADDLKVLEERNQPPLVYNVIKNTMNWILGTERKSRMDYRILPRQKAGAEAAKTKTKLFKYIQDCSKGEFERSFAFTEQVIAGLGWLDIGGQNLREMPIYVRAERWRNMWFDHLGLTNDATDWRFVIREKWVDLDVAQGMFPERKETLRTLAEAVNSIYPYMPDDIIATDTASEFDLESDLDALFGGPFSGNRKRLKLIEMWYRMPALVEIMRMRDDDTPYGALDGAIFRPDNADHQYLVKGNYFSLSSAMKMTVRGAIWTGRTLLQDILTPYNHDRFPFVPVFCYRRKRDNMPYGVVRDLRDPQSDLNKRRSRSLFLLSSNRVMYENSAIDNPVKFHEEINRPDGMAETAKGAITGNKVQIIKDLPLINAHVQMSQDDERFIESISGITPENKGVLRKDLSGKAIEAIQLQGHTTSGVFFDNYYFAFQTAGEILLSLEEQFFDTEKEIRITGDQQKDEFVRINEQGPDGTRRNSIIDSKADFLVGKQDYRETIRVAMFQMLSELVQQLSVSMPQVALALLDLVVDFMDDIPNKEEMVARIRQINKQQAPEDEMSPEEKAAFLESKAKAEAEQNALKQLQMAMAQVELALKQAEAAGKRSQAVKFQIEAEVKKLEGFISALTVAQSIANAPQLTEAADRLITEAAESGKGNGRSMTPQA